MRLYKKKGYEETTLRVATDDSKNPLAIIGTVSDLLAVGLFDYCETDGNRWAIVPSVEDEDVRFAETREDAIRTIKEAMA